MNSAVLASRVDHEFPVSDFSCDAWRRAHGVPIDHYWSGLTAPKERHCSVKLLWSVSAMYIRFDAAQFEPLVIADQPDVRQKTIGLWERDVCEIFIAPNVSEPRRYFEFEVAPTGEWIDLAIDLTSGVRETDWEYQSGMQVAAEIFKDRVVEVIRISFGAFGRVPRVGDVWLGNFFRCVGAGKSRGYLTWQPTETEMPNFHVPEKFGEICFGER